MNSPGSPLALILKPINQEIFHPNFWTKGVWEFVLSLCSGNKHQALHSKVLKYEASLSGEDNPAVPWVEIYESLM